MTRSKKRKQQHAQHQRRPARQRQLDSEPKRIPVMPDDEWRIVLQHHFRRRWRQRLGGWTAVVGGIAVAVNHLFEHVDTINAFGWLLSSRVQDVVTGFPVAAVLVLVGVFLLGQSDEPPKRDYTYV